MGSDRMTLSWGGRDRSVLGAGVGQGSREIPALLCRMDRQPGVGGDQGGCCWHRGSGQRKNEIVPVGSWSGICRRQ